MSGNANRIAELRNCSIEEAHQFAREVQKAFGEPIRYKLIVQALEKASRPEQCTPAGAANLVIWPRPPRPRRPKPDSTGKVRRHESRLAVGHFVPKLIVLEDGTVVRYNEETAKMR